jgi:hypothetical protein
MEVSITEDMNPTEEKSREQNSVRKTYGFYSREAEINNNQSFIYKSLNDETKMINVTSVSLFNSEEEALLCFRKEYGFKDKQFMGKVGDFVRRINTFSSVKQSRPETLKSLDFYRDIKEDIEKTSDKIITQKTGLGDMIQEDD